MATGDFHNRNYPVCLSLLDLEVRQGRVFLSPEATQELHFSPFLDSCRGMSGTWLSALPRDQAVIFADRDYDHP